MSFYLWACPTAPGQSHGHGLRLLEEMHRTILGSPMPPVTLAPRGKPYWEGASRHFSISHTRTMAFCLLADTPVGLDAEPLDRHIAPRLGEKILAPSELALWKARGRDPELLLKFWTLKEAAVKFTGDGLRGYPNDLCFDPETPALEGSSLCFSSFTWMGHRISLCSAQIIPEILPVFSHLS